MWEFIFRVVFSWLAGLCPYGVRSIWVVTELCTNFFRLNTMIGCARIREKKVHEYNHIKNSQKKSRDSVKVKHSRDSISIHTQQHLTARGLFQELARLNVTNEEKQGSNKLNEHAVC